MFSEERRLRILELIRERRKVTVNELCALLQVSPATARGDLRGLDRDGLIIRTHGGAIDRSKTGFEQVSSRRSTRNLSAKQAIAAEADKLIEEGDTLVLDTGTTILELGRRLVSRRELTVVTNDLEIARVLEEAPGVQIVLLGGGLRKGYHCTVGPPGLRMAQGLRVDKAFMATNSLSLEGGATTPDLQQAETKKAMMSIAGKVIMLCDSSKLGRNSFTRFAALNELDVLVTEQISNEIRVKLEEEYGIAVITPQ
jgi:DeoR family fructose operon transcriptional repressor